MSADRLRRRPAVPRQRPPSALVLRSLKEPLERLYQAFNHTESAVDPVDVVRRYDAPDDREVVAFCASALAFGRVASVMDSIEALLAVLGPRPAAFVRGFDPMTDADPFGTLLHRWVRGVDLVALLSVLQRIIVEAGSIESFLLAGYTATDPDVGPALNRFCERARAVDLSGVYGGGDERRGVHYFFPRPDGGSACKRLNLFSPLDGAPRRGRSWAVVRVTSLETCHNHSTHTWSGSAGASD